MKLQQMIDRIEALLKGRALDGWEIMAGESRNLSIEVKDQKVDTFRCSEPIGVSVRLLQGEGLGFSYSTSMAEADLSRMVDNALVGAVTQTPDPCNGLPQAMPIPQLTGLFDPELEQVTEEAKIARAMDLERLTLASDPRLKRVRKSSYGESFYSVAIRNSHGIAAEYCGTSVSSSIAVIAESKGDSQMGWDFGFSSRFDGVDVAKIAAEAARKATALLGAATIPTMRCPAILDSHVSGEILGVLASSFLAESVQKGRSMLAGKLGERLFSPILRIRDNGLLEGGMATTPFDGEGVASQDTLLVEDGQLLRYLYDSYCARKDGCASTGNASRGGVRGLPHMGVTNFYIENGATCAGDLLTGISRGLLLVDVIGMHTANPISGDFSVGASGFLIENGAITRPVKGIAISGNIMELFAKVEAVGDDLRFYGSIASPSLRIASLDVSGT
ncbi:TldD/PmbA family protein [Geobacter pelophilus]|uniref:TldD/PmbA family protein n=2 Tax=Geoanaerobacter pelophilus TaxID=60036 RepID=A0AAW4L375_9BACT|nr:TldD/PmbA family protein [Geoanaerobacter pelophilus]MBT0665599.1 TldD/PmbA family protein [Geoanaerobacter pelophilus]